MWHNFPTHPPIHFDSQSACDRGKKFCSSRGTNDERASNEYMESMDGRKRKKIRIQGHKIKSLSYSLRSPTQQHQRAWFPYVFKILVLLCLSEKLNLAWKAKHELNEREKNKKPSSGCFIMIIYFFLFPLLFLTHFFHSSFYVAVRCWLVVVAKESFWCFIRKLFQERFETGFLCYEFLTTCILWMIPWTRHY